MSTEVDGIDFSMFSYINRYNWIQREYVRMVHKNALLMQMQMRLRK